MYQVRPELVEPALSDVQPEPEPEVRGLRGVQLALVVPGQTAVRPLSAAPPPSLHQQHLELSGAGLNTAILLY